MTEDGLIEDAKRLARLARDLHPNATPPPGEAGGGVRTISGAPRHSEDTTMDEPWEDIPPPNDADAPSRVLHGHPPVGAGGDSPLTATDLDPSLMPVDLEAVAEGSTSQPVPTILTMEDGGALFYEGEVNGIHSDSGIGKGWVVGLTMVQNARRGIRSAYFDFEDGPQGAVGRLTALGMTTDQIVRYITYIRPTVALGPAAVEHLCRLVTDKMIGTVFVDSVGEAFATESIDENKDVEVGPWIRRVARPLADTGAAVILIDHATKAADNPLHPSGSKRKRAAITGASYLLEAVVPLKKGQGGRLRLTCAKDRHGNYGRGEKVADLVMDEDTKVTLYALNAATEDATLPVELAAKAAVAAAKAEAKTLPMHALESLMAIKAKATIKRGGIELAVARGALKEGRGARGARLFSYVCDLTDDLVPPRPTSSQTRSESQTSSSTSSGPIGPARDEVGSGLEELDLAS